jgi:hypothetical protein
MLPSYIQVIVLDDVILVCVRTPMGWTCCRLPSFHDTAAVHFLLALTQQQPLPIILANLHLC